MVHIVIWESIGLVVGEYIWGVEGLGFELGRDNIIGFIS